MPSAKERLTASTEKHRSPCPIACTLDWIGDKWTLLVIRDLLLGKSKFQQFLEADEGVTTNVLSDRLKKLEEIGLIRRHLYQDHPPRAEYLLTPKGRTLGPVIKALYAWGMNNIPGTKQQQRSS
jgi:DNA-binding HxlR family transcriptional regulator